MTDLLTPRAYLVSLGLAKEGRGKFSAAAHAALDAAKAQGMQFAEPVKATPKPRKKVERVTVDLDGDTEAPVRREPKVYPRLPDKPILRPAQTLYAISTAGATTVRIGYDQCFRCHSHMTRCACKDGPMPPAGATPVKDYPKA